MTKSMIKFVESSSFGKGQRLAAILSSFFSFGKDQTESLAVGAGTTPMAGAGAPMLIKTQKRANCDQQFLPCLRCTKVVVHMMPMVLTSGRSL
jgi:hypothetical protein